MSTINLAETLGRFRRDGHPIDPVRAQLDRARIDRIAFTQAHAVLAADLEPDPRPFGLSLGDRACLALARARGEVAMTADRAWGGSTWAFGSS